jgi:hypothetical protein
MMRFFTIVSKVFSLLIAGLDCYAAYLFLHYDKSNRSGPPPLGYEVEQLTTAAAAVVLIGIGLACIWLAEYISQSAEQPTDWAPHGDWAPTWLIRSVGWVFLLIPAVIFIWYKLK